MTNSAARSLESERELAERPQDTSNVLLSDLCEPTLNNPIVDSVALPFTHSDRNSQSTNFKPENIITDSLEWDSNLSDTCSSNPKKRNIGGSSDAGSRGALAAEADKASRSEIASTDSVDIPEKLPDLNLQTTFSVNNRTDNTSLPPSKKRRVSELKSRSPRLDESHHNYDHLQQRQSAENPFSPTKSRPSSLVSSRTTSYNRSVRFENTPPPNTILEFATIEKSADREDNLAPIIQIPNSSNTYDYTTKEPITSPLFFSTAPHLKLDEIIANSGGLNGTPGARPVLPRITSGEAGQTMLSRAQDGEEESRFKFVTLPRASYNDLGLAGGTIRAAAQANAMAALEGENGSASGSSAAIPQTPGGQSIIMGTTASVGASAMSRTSSERHLGWNRSPGEKSDRVESIRILSQIGVIELLEQDSRPIFMIDLADVHNSPKSLHIIFANSALRACPSLFDSIQLHPESPYVTQNTDRAEGFYRWLLSYNTEGHESPDAQEKSFGNAIWTCSTLRGRLRIISATQTVHSLTDTPSNLPRFMSRSIAPSVEPSMQGQSNHRTPISTALFSNHEGSDYFGPRSYASPVLDSPASGSRRGNLDDSIWRETATSHPANDSPIHDIGFFDWTRMSNSAELPLHIQFARSIDWAATPLGPMSGWSIHLRETCNLIMASPHPAALYWGPELVAIYNEAYVPLAGQKHPVLMGQRYSDAWAEIWDQLEMVFREARETGQATMKDDDRLFVNRFNYLEETFFSWSIIPLVGGDGTVVGLYNPCFEMTNRKITERRMITLREVGERTAMARDVKGFWREVRFGLEINKWDTPFMLLYSVTDETDSDASSVMSGSLMGSKQCFLEGAFGVPEDHGCAPKVIELKSGNEGFGPLFREAMKADGPILVRVAGAPHPGEQTNLPEDPKDFHSSAKDLYEIPYEMLEGIQWRGFGDPCRSVVICKVHPTTSDNILGFVVLGVNPRRPYDEDYNLFVQLLTRQIATSLASVVLFEDEIKRGQRAAQLAALDRIQLSAQLEQRTQEARDLEIRFTHMAELSPAGLFIADSSGKLSYCNDSWYEISGIPKDPVSANRWIDFVMDSDQPRVRKIWSKLLEDHEPATAEFRLKKRWTDQAGHRWDTWVLFSAHPEMVPGPGIDGISETQIRSLFCNLTDISSQKRAQAFEKQKMEEAVEMKRQQENFIDITSHEMRNPLSAILQCADDITVSLGELVELHEQKQLLSKHEIDQIGNSIDAADTIILCAQHQKRIVDDVLTLSKLDSHMLTVTPVDVQPLHIMSRVLKMFEPQTTSAGISLKMIVDDSIGKLDVDWVKLDPQRISQVLINLLSNAIKFTENQQRMVAATADNQSSAVPGIEGANAVLARGTSITVSIAAYAEEPAHQPDPVVQYFTYRRSPERQSIKKAVIGVARGTSNPKIAPVEDLDDPSSEWGSGDKIYLQFAVTDTGPGLKDSEKKLLFNRFTQASPRTHVTYGGSGLGLFISRELAELQGGKIGVASEYGKGSTFAFYIRARKSKEPEEEEDREMGIPLNLKNIVSGSGENKARRSTNLATNQTFGSQSTIEGVASSGTETRPNDFGSPARAGVLSVLVVEDNIVNQRVLQKQLQNKGFIVHVANHGGEALETLRKTHFWADSTSSVHIDSQAQTHNTADTAHKNNSHISVESTSSQKTGILDLHVVLMDQEMPIMDGLECTKVIREWEREGKLSRHVPIIGVTANARQQQIDSLLNAGMDDVVSKPFRILDLIPKIEGLATQSSS